MSDMANNPFCRRADPETYGDRIDWLCTHSADERIRMVREMDAPTLRRALLVPELQRTVRSAIESRLRRLDNPSLPKAHTSRITAAITRNMGTRFCSSCQADRPNDGGKWSLNRLGARSRWRCAACMRRAAQKTLHKEAGA